MTNMKKEQVLGSVSVLVCLVQAALSSSTALADILGGDEVESGDPIAHSTIALYQQTAHGGALCTASLITKNIAVTAAHCVEHGIDHMAVILGEKIESEDRDVLRVVDAQISPEWSEARLAGEDAGDIALVKFKGKLPKGYGPAHLIPKSAEAELSQGEEVILAGYGITNASKKVGAGTLRQASVKIAQPEFGKTEILFDQHQGSGACHGDSGGPAFIQIKGKDYLLGVTSRGYPVTAPDDCKHKVIYTKVAAYRDWIKATVKELNVTRY
jgi:secreted trypsin-like serine protease